MNRNLTTQPDTRTETTPEPRIRLVASYQLMGDSHGEEFMDAVLGVAIQEGDIVAYEVTGVYVGAYGLQLVDFTVDVTLGATGRFNVAQSYDEAKEAGTDLLNEVIGDSDVEVRWVSPLVPATA